MTVAIVLCATAVYWLCPPDMPELAKRTAALFVFAAAMWALEIVPLFAVSLCLVAAEIALLAEHGGLAGTGGLSFKIFLEPLSSGIMILFLGGFLLARALSKSGLDRALAHRILDRFRGSPLRFVYGVLFTTAFLSFWMSNTAAAAIMLAIVLPIVGAMPRGRYAAAVVLAVPFGANLGGLGVLTSTPPNVIAASNLREAGIRIGFVEWSIAGIPFVILTCLAAGAILWLFFRSEKPAVPEIPPAPRSAGPGARTVAAIAIATIALWVTYPLHGIDEAVVALTAAAALAAFGILNAKDVDSIEWNVLLMMWGGLSLSTAMSATGLTAWIGNLPFASLPPAALLTGFTFGAALLSLVMSNTAAANVLVPIAIAVSGERAAEAAILTAFACSLDFALPVSTPPNAMAFATGKITARQMLLLGGTIAGLSVVLLVAGYRVVLPLAFGAIR